MSDDRRVNVPFLVTAIILVAAIVAFIIFFINTQDNFRRVRNDIAALRTELSTQIATSSTTIQNNVQNQLNNANLRVATLEANQTTANGIDKALQDQLNSTVTQINGQLTTLQNNISKVATDLSAVSGAPGQIASLQQKLDSITTQVSGFTTQLNGFTAQLNAFQTNEQSQTNKIATLETTVNSINTQLASIQTSINTLNTQISTLQQQQTVTFFNSTVSIPAQSQQPLVSSYTPPTSGNFYISGSATGTGTVQTRIVQQVYSGGILISTLPYNFGTGAAITISAPAGYTYNLYFENQSTTAVQASLTVTFRTQ